MKAMARTRQGSWFRRIKQYFSLFLGGTRVKRSRIHSKVARFTFEALNRERRRRGLSELHFHSGYADLCRDHSRSMARAGQIFHGDNPRRIHSSWSGENVAEVPMGRVRGFRHRISSERDVALALHRMWINSPGHRANMLNPRFRQVGIGVHRRGNRYYATQLFSS